MSTQDPPGGVSRRIFLSPSSISAAVASATRLSASLLARAVPIPLLQQPSLLRIQGPEHRLGLGFLLGNFMSRLLNGLQLRGVRLGLYLRLPLCPAWCGACSNAFTFACFLAKAS